MRARFNTNASTGAPITIVGATAGTTLPTVAVSKDGADITPTGASVNLVIDKGGVAGRHEVSIDTSADTTNFTAGSEYSVRLTAGTADSVSLIGLIVGEWSIANRTVGTIAAGAVSSIWQDPIAGADFATANTVGNLLVGGLTNGPGGVVAAGSSTTTVIVTGNATMTAASGAYATATVLVNGQFRKVVGHAFSAGAHTFTLGTGTGANGPLPTGLPVTGSNLAILGQ